MRGKQPAEITEIARARKNGAAKAVEKRETQVLSPEGAVMSVMNQVLKQDAMKIAVSSFLEGRALGGDWTLRVTGAELVPVK